MRRNVSELAAGTVVLVVAGAFLAYAVVHTGRSDGGYSLHASFDSVGGLTPGADVRMAGVKVGTVEQTSIDPKTFQAQVTFSVASAIALPKDSSAQVSSAGLLGGPYLSLVPGGDTANIPPGGTVTITQGAVSLEDLLGKFIFNVGDLSSNVGKALEKGLPPAAPK